MTEQELQQIAAQHTNNVRDKIVEILTQNNMVIVTGIDGNEYLKMSAKQQADTPINQLPTTWAIAPTEKWRPPQPAPVTKEETKKPAAKKNSGRPRGRPKGRRATTSNGQKEAGREGGKVAIEG